MKWKEILEPFYGFFLCPFCREKAKGCRFFFKHIKFEILMIYRERKRERESGRERERGTRGRGGGRGV